MYFQGIPYNLCSLTGQGPGRDECLGLDWGNCFSPIQNLFCGSRSRYLLGHADINDSSFSLSLSLIIYYYFWLIKPLIIQRKLLKVSKKYIRTATTINDNRQGNSRGEVTVAVCVSRPMGKSMSRQVIIPFRKSNLPRFICCKKTQNLVCDWFGMPVFPYL